ncbi:hypothetical protein [Arenibaculum sp.]|jgi:hypothetical protein|uniref:hypothetical protein n=1 Tax=Arenibaculum sp. TaxID=2865862 RepID=UPI002E0FE46F|nr:hypothetical protein [Arenibaculum sp.]
MTIRRSLLAAATLALLAGPALAGGLETGGVPLSTTNQFSATNVAAGEYNYADQSVWATQQGAPGGYGMLPHGGQGMLPHGGQGMLPGGPLAVTNVGTATNVAAGIGNVADQDVTLIQQGSGALATTNVFDATNVAAGLHNFANQDVFAIQK